MQLRLIQGENYGRKYWEVQRKFLWFWVLESNDQYFQSTFYDYKTANEYFQDTCKTYSFPKNKKIKILKTNQGDSHVTNNKK